MKERGRRKGWKRKTKQTKYKRKGEYEKRLKTCDQGKIKFKKERKRKER